MSKFSKLTYEDLESIHINDPTFFYVLSGFCIEDGKRDRIGNKTLTYFCRTCCSSPDTRIVKLNNEGRFKTIKRKVKNNKYPCACSNQKKRLMRALGVDLDLNTQYSRDKCIYTVESYSHTDANGLRLYNISCNVCSLDKELYPEPFKAYISTLEGKQYLCGCGGKRYYKKFQVEILSRRLCEEIGYEFLTLSEKFKGVTTKLTFRCDLGHETSNTSYHYLERGVRCSSCSRGGYDSNKSGVFYLQHLFGTFYKYGITNRSTNIRMNEQYGKHKSFEHTELLSYRFSDGEIPLKIEGLIKNTIDVGVLSKNQLPNGYTETFSVEDLPEFMYIIREYLDMGVPEHLENL